MSHGLIPTDASPSSESRLLPAHPSLLAQGSAPFGFYGVPLAFQPIPQGAGAGARQSQDLPKRRVSEARRQRTPMSCDRCKVRKIKCINPTPGPCGYCTRMKFHCQITAQRKHRPLYFTSDEQFQWMIALLQHFVPDINLELDGLKALGAQLGVVGPAPPPSAQAPMRSLPPTLERAYGQGLESSSNPSENIAGSTQSPVSDFLGEEELDISEDHVPTPNDDSFNPPTRTMAQYDKYDVPVKIGSPGYSFSSVAFGNFPERAIADIYVERYFNEINNVIWVLSYQEFMSWYQYYDLSTPLNATRHVILSLVFAFGANDVSIRETYYSNALNLIGSIIKEGGLHSVQALTLMSLYSMHDTRVYITWTLTGLAIRIAQGMNLMQDNDSREQNGQDIRRRVWWTLYDMERLFSSNLSLTSSVIDECVNTSLPTDQLSPADWVEAQQNGEMVKSPPPGYTECSISLSQILGRTATYLSQPTISLFTLLHYFNELQEWSDTLPGPFRQISPFCWKYHAFLSLRWRHAVMVAMRPFLSSLALLSLFSLPVKLRGFFEFCANTAVSAARESLDLIKSRKQEGDVKGITAFYRLFLLQSAAVLALSAVIRQGRSSDRSSYRECLELLTQLPGGIDQQRMGDMHMVENKLKQFAVMRGTKLTDTFHSFYSPMPSLSFKQLAYQFNLPNIPDKNEENLARWISRKVTWEDISECIIAGLKREGLTE